MPPSDAAPRSAQWWHGPAVFATAITLFLLLPQRLLHSADGNLFAVWIEEGNTAGYARHAAYLHFGSWIYAGLEPFGAGGVLALRVASAIGTALGLSFLYRAFALLSEGTPPAALLTIAVAATPAWFYYATTAEIPGVFVAGAGAAWWTFARWLARPTCGRAIAVGIAAACAAGLHAFGHLLTPSFLLVALLLRRTPTANRALQVTAMLGSHAVIALLLSVLLANDATGQSSDAVSHLEERWQTFAPLTAPMVLWREWIVAFLPWSIGVLLALFGAGSRRWALAAVTMLALHLPLCVLLLGYHEIDEGGAYLVALTPAAVLATARFVTRRGFVLTIAAGWIVTMLAMAPGWRDPVPPAFGEGVDALNDEHKIALIVSGKEELAGARTAVSGLMAMELGSVIGAYVQLPQPAPPFAQWFDGWHDNLRRAGMTTVLTDAVRRFLAETTDVQIGPFWREHVPANYELREVERAGFRGVILTRR